MSKPKTRGKLTKDELWQWIIEQEQIMLVDYECLPIEENPPKGYIEEREEYYQKCKQAYNQVKKIIKQHFGGNDEKKNNLCPKCNSDDTDLVCYYTTPKKFRGLYYCYNCKKDFQKRLDKTLNL